MYVFRDLNIHLTKLFSKDKTLWAFILVMNTFFGPRSKLITHPKPINLYFLPVSPLSINTLIFIIIVDIISVSLHLLLRRAVYIKDIKQQKASTPNLSRCFNTIIY